MAVLDISPLRYENDKLMILDQTKLPGEEVFEEMTCAEDVWDAIYKLKVRGAPAIGVAAAYGLYISVRDYEGDMDGFLKYVKEKGDYLCSARPTAVNLEWAIKRMTAKLTSQLDDASSEERSDATPVEVGDAIPGERSETVCGACSNADSAKNADATTYGLTVLDAKQVLEDEAKLIEKEDIAACLAMGEYGLKLLKPGMGILTHCNAGTIATAKYGTCLAPIHLGQERGYNFKVFADETRPLLQGARLTAWELNKAGVDVTLICDNMASQVMKNGWVDAIVVGCDRMAANGDGANKIGTSGVAILAKEYGIPFYMFVPTSTIDMNTPTGDDIHIELRDGNEIREMWYEKPMAPDGIKTYNPAFDVTPAEYITAVVTEKGIVYPPYTENLKEVFK